MDTDHPDAASFLLAWTHLSVVFAGSREQSDPTSRPCDSLRLGNMDVLRLAVEMFVVSDLAVYLHEGRPDPEALRRSVACFLSTKIQEWITPERFEQLREQAADVSSRIYETRGQA